MRKLMPLLGGILLGFGIGIVIFFGFLNDDVSPKMSDLTQGSAPQPIPSLGAPAPGFELSSLSGETIQLEDYRGKIVLLNFWATWCAPCRLEMPAFQSSAEIYGDELAVVAINNAESPGDVQTFVTELGLTFDVLLDPEAEVQRLYSVRGYPTSVLIDADGIIRIQHIGLMTEDQLEGYLQELGIGQ
jgi:peroxiredoxin